MNDQKTLVQPGISVIICCHNSEKLIATTLTHLIKQELPAQVGLEIILVDNASEDQTGRIAQTTWDASLDKTDRLLAYRYVFEPVLGLSYARFRGVQEAQYEYVIFCDDDNYLAPDYCEVALEVMQADGQVGACGGLGIPLFEGGDAPELISRISLSLAIGPQYAREGYLDSYALYGAGLVLRRSVVRRLLEVEYQPILKDRTGQQLTSGGDEELTMWCKIMGYRLYYTPRLQFQHFIRDHRLQIGYLRQLYRGIGVSLAKQVPLQLILFDREKTYHRWWLYQCFRLSVITLKNCLDFRKEPRLKSLDCLASRQRWSTFLLGKKQYLHDLHYLTGMKRRILCPTS